MKNKKNIKLAVFMMAALLIPSNFSVLAASTKETIDVFFSDIKLFVDGKKLKIKNVDDKEIEPFIYSGEIYLPGKAVAEALGKKYTWDASTGSIYVGQVDELDNNLKDICPPYQFSRLLLSDINNPITMAGKKYHDCYFFELGDGANNDPGFALFNLDGQYEEVSGVLGHIDGTSMLKSTITIYLDGELVETIEIDPYDLPQKLELDVTGALQMRIYAQREGNYGSHVDIGLGNLEIR